LRIVIDASVVVKWVLNDSEREPDTSRALQLLEGIRDGSVEPLQPTHWLAEVAAVVTRLRPEIAETTLDLLDAMELPMATDLMIYKRASRLAAALNHHLFDTLYHAVALERDATLVTADAPYLRKAGHLGAIMALQAWGEAARRAVTVESPD
jgi:predicted nucleic acid-binding protein